MVCNLKNYLEQTHIVYLYLSPSSTTFWISDNPNIIWSHFKIIDFLGHCFHRSGNVNLQRVRYQTIQSRRRGIDFLSLFFDIIRDRVPLERIFAHNCCYKCCLFEFQSPNHTILLCFFF